MQKTHPCDKHEHKYIGTVSSSHDATISTMSSASDDAVSSRTRSRLDSSAPAFQPISPVGQVDGPSNPKPSHCYNPQAVGKEVWPMSTPEWAKTMMTLLDTIFERLFNDEDDFGFG